MMTINDAIASVSDHPAGKRIAELAARHHESTSGDRAALLEIALLALCEAARITEDETDLQDAIDEAQHAVSDAIEASCRA